ELFRDGGVSVSTIECGAEPDGSLHLQAWDRPTIVLVRTGRFRRRARGRSTVVDSTQGYVADPADEDWIQHLGSSGHRCTVLTLGPDALPALFRVRARLAPGEFRT